MASDAEVKAIIAETISALHADEAQLLFKKPRTLHAWIYIALGLGAIIAFCWGAVVFLNDIAQHSKAPHHEGTLQVLNEIKGNNEQHHYNEELHRGKAELELKILRDTEPIRQDLSTLKDDVRQIQSSVDILVEDARRRRNNP